MDPKIRAEIDAENEARMQASSDRIDREVKAYSLLVKCCPLCGPGTEIRIGSERSGCSWPGRAIQCVKCGIKITDNWDSPDKWNNRYTEQI